MWCMRLRVVTFIPYSRAHESHEVVLVSHVRLEGDAHEQGGSGKRSWGP